MQKLLLVDFASALATGLYYLGEWVNKSADAREKQAELDRTVNESSEKMLALKTTSKNLTQAMILSGATYDQIKVKILEYQNSINTTVPTIQNLKDRYSELEELLKDHNGWNNNRQGMIDAYTEMRVLKEAIADLEGEFTKNSEVIEAYNAVLQKLAQSTEKAKDSFYGMDLRIVKEEGDTLDKDTKTFRRKLDELTSKYNIAANAIKKSNDQKNAENELTKLNIDYSQKHLVLIENLNKARDAKKSKNEVKEIDKLVKAQKEYDKLLKAGVGAIQLEEARKEIEKWDGTLKRKKEAEEAAKKKQLKA